METPNEAAQVTTGTLPTGSVPVQTAPTAPNPTGTPTEPAQPAAPAAPEAAAPEAAAPEAPAQPVPLPSTVEKKFSQAELDVIVQDRLDRARKAAETKAANEAAKAQGDYKTLYESERAAREADAAARLAELRTAHIEKLATDYKLPAPIAKLLAGDTNEALTAHAIELAAAIPAPVTPAPEINATKGGTAPAAKPGVLSDERKKELAHRFRIKLTPAR